MALAKTASRGVVLQIGLNVALFFLGIVNNVTLTRLLTPQAFGAFALGVLIYDFVQRIRVVGLNYSLMNKPELDDADLQTHFQLKASFTMAALIVALLAAPFLGRRYDALVIAVALGTAGAGFLDTEGLAGTPVSWLERHLQYGRITKIELAGNLASVACGIALAWMGAGAWSLFTAQKLVLPGVILIGAWYYCRWRPTFPWKWDPARVRWFLVSQGRYLWAAGILNFVTLSVDSAIVGTFLGVSELGYYSRAQSLVRMPLLFLGSVSRVAFPVYAAVQKEPERVRKAFTETVGLLARGGTLFALLFAVAGPELVRVLYGLAWTRVGVIVAVFSIAALSRPLFDALGGFMIAVGETRRYMYVAGLYTIISLVAVTVGVRNAGAPGAAIGNWVAMLAGVVALQIEIAHRFSMRVIPIYLPSLVSALAAGLLVTAGSRFLPALPPVPVLLIKGTSAALLYGVGLLILDRAGLLQLARRFVGVVRPGNA